MQFPTTYITFTVPTGAGPGTSRIVLNADGSLISYDNTFSPGSFVGLKGGRLLYGPQTAGGTADFTQEGSIGFVVGSPSNWTQISGNTDTARGLTQSPAFQLFPGNATTQAAIEVSSGSADLIFNVVGDLWAGNIQTGSVTMTPAVAGQWFTVAVVFPATFDVVPVVILEPQSSAPTDGGTTAFTNAVSNVTKTGFNAHAMRGTTTAFSMGYLAIGSFAS